MSLFNQVVIFNFSVHSISGRFKLDAEVLGIPENELPEKELASLGTMKCVPTQTLNALRAFDARFRTLFLKNGTQTPLGFAVPRAEAKRVYLEALELQKEFEKVAQGVIDDADTAVKDWAKAHPQYEEHILKRGYSSQRLRKQLRVNLTAISASGVNTAPDDILNQTMVQAEAGLVPNLLQEIAEEANATLKSLRSRASDGNEGISGKTFSKYELLIKKLRSFGFVHPKMRSLAERMEDMARSAQLALQARPEGQRYVIGNDYDRLVKELEWWSSTDQTGKFINEAFVPQSSALTLQMPEPPPRAIAPEVRQGAIPPQLRGFGIQRAL